MPAVPSISRWDAIAGEELIVFLDPGPCPVGAGWTNAGIYISQIGGKLVHLSGSERLVRHVQGRKTIIVVEADERPYRMMRVEIRRIGARK